MPAPPRRSPEPTLTVRRILTELSQELQPGQPPPRLGPGTHLERDLGYGSLERVELHRRLEQALGRPLPDRPVFSAATLAELERAVAGSEGALGGARGDEATPWNRPDGLPARLGGPPPGLEAPRRGALEPPPPSLGEALARQARRRPGATWLQLLDGDREGPQLTFSELADMAARAAEALYRLGITPGDRVAMILPTGLDFFRAFFGAVWAGAVPVPLYPPLRPSDLEESLRRQERILLDAGARLLVTDGHTRRAAALLDARLPQVAAAALTHDRPAPRWPAGPRDLALLQYTSGSTGHPKGIRLHQAALMANIQAYGRAVEAGPEERVVSWLPLYHDMGLVGAALGSLAHGVPLILMSPLDFLGRPSRWLWALHRAGGTLSAAPNFAYELCVRKIPEAELEGLDLSRWRVALNGSEPVQAATLARFEARFARYGFGPEAWRPAYGLAEAAVAVAIPPHRRPPRIDRLSRAHLEERGLALPPEPDEAAARAVSCGPPVEGIQLRISDHGGRPLEERHVGRVLFRGGSMMLGYQGGPDLGPGEWLDTGDTGYLADGELYLTGRSRDLILKGGRNLDPADLEAEAAEVEGIRRGCVAAFGAANPETGTADLVIVAETRTPDPEARRALAGQIHGQLARALGVPPDRVLLVGPHTLPKTPSGKLRRGLVRARWLEGSLERQGRLRGSRVWNLARRGLAGVSEEVWRAWCLAAAATCTAPVSLWGALTGAPAPRGWVQPCARAALGSIGIRLEVEGELASEGALGLAANHSSMIDGLVLAASLPQPLRFVAARWVLAHPLYGAVTRGAGALEIARGTPEVASEELARLGAELEAGRRLVVFPEGGMDPVPGIRPFAMGLFLAACQTGAPIQPVALVGTRRALPPELWRVRPGRIRVRIGPPLRGAGPSWSAAAALAREARDWISRASGEPLVEGRLRRVDPGPLEDG